MHMRLPLILIAMLLPLAPVVAKAVAPPQAVAAPHDRLLPLQGGNNFRDLGGYRAADGRSVRWGLLFRSGAMASLTPAESWRSPWRCLISSDFVKPPASGA